MQDFVFVGVDPGKTGAIAFVAPDGGLLALYPMPLVTGRGRDEFDIPTISGIMTSPSPWGILRMVTVERQQPLPRRMGGASANFQRGVTHGWAWLLTALSLPHNLVTPTRWQRTMLAGTSGLDTGQRSIIAAQRLWPATNFKRTERAKKLDDGFTDAALLAEYGRRQFAGAIPD